MTDNQNVVADDDDVDHGLIEDAVTPLEELEPVELQEVDEEPAQPPEHWGQDGQGHDAEEASG